MTEFYAAVYEPPLAGELPLVAVILSNGEVKLAFAVSSIVEGEAKLNDALRGLKEAGEDTEA